MDHSRPQQTPPRGRMRTLKEWSASLLHPDRWAFPNCPSRRNSRCHLPRDLCSNRLLFHAVPSEPTFSQGELRWPFPSGPQTAICLPLLTLSESQGFMGTAEKPLPYPKASRAIPSGVGWAVSGSSQGVQSRGRKTLICFCLKYLDNLQG